MPIKMQMGSGLVHILSATPLRQPAFYLALVPCVKLVKMQTVKVSHRKKIILPVQRIMKIRMEIVRQEKQKQWNTLSTLNLQVKQQSVGRLGVF